MGQGCIEDSEVASTQSADIHIASTSNAITENPRPLLNLGLRDLRTHTSRSTILGIARRRFNFGKRRTKKFKNRF